MFGVSFFGTYNFVLFKPALDVILYNEEKLKETVKDVQKKKKEQQEKLGRYLKSDSWVKRQEGKIKALYYPIMFQGKDRMIDLYQYASRHRTQSLRLIAAILVSSALLKGFFDYAFRYNLSYALYSAIIQMKTDIFRHIMSQDMRYFTENSTGWLMSRITSDAQALRSIFEMLIRNGALETIRLFFLMSILIVMSPKLTGLVFIGVIPALGLLVYFAYVIKKVTRKQKRTQDILSAVMNESLTNVRLVKSLSTEDYECDKFEKHNRRLFYYEMNRRLAKFASSPIMEILGSIGLGLILLAAGWVVIRDKVMEPTEFMIYLGLLTQFYGPLKHMSRLNVSWQQGAVSALRITEMLDIRASVTDPENPDPSSHLEKVNHGLILRDVSFRYKDKAILENICLEIPAGKTTALVGRSGSGKSTLANLLLRLYDPDAGAILLDNLDLRAFQLKDLRRHFGIVTQETFLFNETIANNIAYGCDDFDIDRINDAAKAAHAHDFIMELDGGKGYDTNVGPNGCQLSGGQRQRIAIARAFYRDPEILILDEATSSLDTQSEAAVQEALEPLMRDRTVVVISHRLSTIKNADTIVVMEAGRIIEKGTHGELVALGGHYALLCRHGDLSVDEEKPAKEFAEEPPAEAMG